MGGRRHLDRRNGHARYVAPTSAAARSGTVTNRERKFCRCISPCSGRGSAFGGLLMVTALLGDCRMPAAVLLVAQVCKSGFTLLALLALLASQSLVIDPDKEAAVVGPS